MPRHDATTWKLPKGYEGLVGNSNTEIEVRQTAKSLRGKAVGARKRNSELLGHLLISKGGLEWRPRSGKYSREMRWEEFARMMERPKNLLSKRRSLSGPGTLDANCPPAKSSVGTCWSLVQKRILNLMPISQCTTPGFCSAHPWQTHPSI